jgi:uncharacterized membrane protein
MNNSTGGFIAVNTAAPVKTEQTIIINAPVEVAWKVFTGINDWSAWQKDITSSKINSPVEPGANFDWKSGGMTIHSTLHTVDRFHMIGWTGKAFGTFAIHNWTFEKEKDHTIVTVEESMEGWLVNLLKKYLQSKLESSTRNWLRFLKTQSEKGT